jgi:hypothetical protein
VSLESNLHALSRPQSIAQNSVGKKEISEKEEKKERLWTEIFFFTLIESIFVNFCDDTVGQKLQVVLNVNLKCSMIFIQLFKSEIMHSNFIFFPLWGSILPSYFRLNISTTMWNRGGG